MGERVRVAIVGGGISGLALGYQLVRRGISVRVLEADARPGGNIRSESRDGYRIEWGPNGFLDNEPATLRLLDALGPGVRVVRAGDAARTRWVVRRGRLRALPASPAQFLTSDILSPGGRARALLEWTRPARRDNDDESVWDFARRRIGREAADVLVDAMVTGVYAGDARRLSVMSAFPRMRAMEREHGGLFRALSAARRAGAGASDGGPFGPGGTLTSFADGMESLVHALAAALGASLRCDANVQRISRAGSGWRIETEHGAPAEGERLVLACPSSQAAALLLALDHALAEQLERIPSAPVAVVALGWSERDVASVPRGFGYLVPTRERLGVLGTLYDSWIFPGRAPAGKVLWRTMIGGARDRGAIDLDDATLVQRALAAAEKLLGVRATPELTGVVRHARGIPQYPVGHRERLVQIEERLGRHPDLWICGNSYHGVAMNACIREAEQIAERCDEKGGAAA